MLGNRYIILIGISIQNKLKKKHNIKLNYYLIIELSSVYQNKQFFF